MQSVLRRPSRGPVFLGLVVILAVSLGLGLASSFAASSTPSASPGKVVLRAGLLESPDNLNPFLGNFWSSYLVWTLNYDSLTNYDPKTLEPEPGLATSWSVSPDGKTWTFNIRHGVTWQDGQPLTARDIAFTFNYIVDNETSTPSVYTEDITHATAVNDYEVQIQTKKPKANMLQMGVSIVPEHIWSRVPGKAAVTTYVSRPPIVGSGPFQVVDFQPNKFVRFVANKNYWGGAPKIDEVVFQIYENPQNMVNDLRSGQIQLARDVPTAQFGALPEVAGIATNKGVSWTFNELGFNCYDSSDSLGNPVLRDPQFRRALQYAVDREAICKTAWQDYAAPGSTLIVPYSFYRWQPPAEETYSYDPEKASSLLNAAGYKMGSAGVRLDKLGKPIVLRLYVTSDWPQNQVAGRLVVDNLKRIGIKVKLSSMDSGALVGAMYNYKGDTYAPDWDMDIWYWGQDADPQFILGSFIPSQIENLNEYNWVDEEYARLNAEESATIDRTARRPIVQRMQEIVHESTPFIVLDYTYQLEAYDTAHWTGWVKTPDNVPGWSGAVWNSWTSATFVNVHPVVATAAEAEGVNTGVIVALVIAAVIVVAAVLWLFHKRRGRAVEEG